GLCTHNPTVHHFDGTYYLYYMGNTGDGKPMATLNWSHRNNQLIGVAVADHPAGPWTRSDQPLIPRPQDPQAHDALMMSNPSITRRPDGTFVLVYKCVGKKRPLPGGGPVVHMAATSDSPTGPFKKHPTPIFTAKGDRFPAEDPFIWTQNGQLYAILKDMKGAFTDHGQSLVLFQSKDGLDWQLAPQPLVSTLQINWADGSQQKLAHLERPQLYLENGTPKVLFCAADLNRNHSFNVHIPLSSSTR
ncbi:MAG: glycoside hydrolase family protein, partial [Verrucomicrobiota bacterium]